MIDTCPSTEQLRRMTLGELSEESSGEMLGHVRDCDACRARLEQVDLDDTLVGLLRDDTEEDSIGFETGCRDALVKALGSLAASRDGGETWQDIELPKLIGEYEIVRPIGQGGMSRVYLARHTKLDREVAVKVVSSRRLGGSEVGDRFSSEMRIIGKLSHPNIVAALDAREVDGLAVLVTELIDGLDASETVRRLGPCSVSDACAIGAAVASALEYIHEQQLVHRDVKPSNIMIDQQGNVKLLDLGLARIQQASDQSGEITATGQAMGTADYVAPEQVSDARSADGRADVYGLGCTLFKLLSGRAPFDTPDHATAFAKLNAHVSTPAPSLASAVPHVPPSLIALVDQMLEKDPAQRPAEMKQVAAELQQHATGANLEQLVSIAMNASPPKESNSYLGPALKVAPARTSLATAITCLLVGIAIGAFAGVMITIRWHDGTAVTVDAPSGSHIGIDETPKVTVQLENTSDGRPISDSGKPTYSGKTREEWFRDLKTERNPERLIEALDALDSLTDDESRQDLIDAAFEIMRTHGSRTMDSGPRGQLIAACVRVIWLSPPETIVESLLSEIENGNRNSRNFMIWLLHSPGFENANSESLKRDLFRHMRLRKVELATLLLRLSNEGSPATKSWALWFLLSWCRAADVDEVEIDGLLPRLPSELSNPDLNTVMLVTDVLSRAAPDTPQLVETLVARLQAARSLHPVIVADPALSEEPIHARTAIRQLWRLGPRAEPAVSELVRLYDATRFQAGGTGGLLGPQDSLLSILMTLAEIGPGAKSALTMLRSVANGLGESPEFRSAAAKAIRAISGESQDTKTPAIDQDPHLLRGVWQVMSSAEPPTSVFWARPRGTATTVVFFDSGGGSYSQVWTDGKPTHLGLYTVDTDAPTSDIDIELTDGEKNEFHFRGSFKFQAGDKLTLLLEGQPGEQSTALELQLVTRNLGNKYSSWAALGPTHLSLARRDDALTVSRDLGRIRRGLVLYHKDVGTLPTEEQGLESLRTAPSTLANRKSWKGPYIPSDITNDPWGSHYKYRVEESGQFQIWSVGADRKSGTEDDIADRPTKYNDRSQRWTY